MGFRVVFQRHKGGRFISTVEINLSPLKDTITMREAVFPDRVTPPPTTDTYKKAPRSGEAKMSGYIMERVWEGFTPPPLAKYKSIDSGISS